MWHSLATSRRAGAHAFYGSLFGWTVHGFDLGADGAGTFRSGSGDVALLLPPAGDVESAARWLSYAAVRDLDDALELVRRAGGTVVAAPAETAGIGRAAVVADPQGAWFGLVRAPDAAAASPDVSGPGHFCWCELLSTDPHDALRFYPDVFGWTAVERNLGEHGQYWIFSSGDRDVAGMMQPTPRADHACWLPYVEVVNAEETAAEVESLGGAIVTPPGDVPGRGRFAVVRDPEGALVAVYALTVAA
jgi:hypothetical protein